MNYQFENRIMALVLCILLLATSVKKSTAVTEETIGIVFVPPKAIVCITSNMASYTGIASVSNIVDSISAGKADYNTWNAYKDSIQTIIFEKDICGYTKELEIPNTFSSMSNLQDVYFVDYLFGITKLYDVTGILSQCPNLKHLYTTKDFVYSVSKLFKVDQLFNDSFAIVGGMGTTYQGDDKGIDYARTDGLNNKPGYFTTWSLVIDDGLVELYRGGTLLTGSAGTGDVLQGKFTNELDTLSGLTYQWTKDGNNIAGETTPYYTVKSEDEGHTIGVTISGTSDYSGTGSKSVTVKQSNATVTNGTILQTSTVESAKTGDNSTVWLMLLFTAGAVTGIYRKTKKHAV